MLAVAQKALLVENGLVFEHGINGSGDLMGKDGQRFGLVACPVSFRLSLGVNDFVYCADARQRGI